MPQAFEHGMGRTAGEWLAAHAAKTRAVRVPAGTALAEPIVVHAHGKNAAASVASLDVVVEEGASAQVLVCFDAPEAGEGVIGSTLGVFADADAHVDIQTVHAASDGFTTMDDTALFLDDDARITVRHTVLGAGKSFVGLTGNLSGKRSDVHVTTRYVGHGEEALDFNYLLRHRARKPRASWTRKACSPTSARKFFAALLIWHAAARARKAPKPNRSSSPTSA